MYLKMKNKILLAESHPELLKEWNYEKNFIKPQEITAGSNKKIYWICIKCAEPFFLSPKDKIRAKNLNYCKHSKEIYNRKPNIKTFLYQKFPELQEEWSKTNKLKFNEVSVSSDIKADWICKKCKSFWAAKIGHRVKSSIDTQNGGCPFCNGKKVNETNSLAVKIPELVKFWSFNNIISPNNVAPHSRKSVKWICDCCNNEYCQPIWEKTKNYLYNRNIKCLECSGNRFSNQNITKEYLNNILKIEIINQYPIERIKNQSRNGGKIKIDFKFELNSQIYFIEYNGGQHYSPITFFSSSKEQAEIAFKKQQSRDEFVRQYCKDNNIILIEIDGRKYQFNKIEEFLINKFKELNIISF